MNKYIETNPKTPSETKKDIPARSARKRVCVRLLVAALLSQALLGGAAGMTKSGALEEKEAQTAASFARLTAASFVYADGLNDEQQERYDALCLYVRAKITQLHLSDTIKNRLWKEVENAKSRLEDTKATNLMDQVLADAKTQIDAIIAGNSPAPIFALYDTYAVQTVSYGDTVTLPLAIVNYGDTPLYNVVVEAKVSNLVSEWPFVPDPAGATQTVRAFPAYNNAQHTNAIDMNAYRQDIAFTFVVRDDVKTGYYPIKFNIKYRKDDAVTEMEEELVTYIHTVGREGSGELEKNDYGFFVSDNPGEATTDVRIHNQYVERANVDLVQQMTDMIAAERAYQSAAEVTKIYDELMTKATTDVGRL